MLEGMAFVSFTKGLCSRRLAAGGCSHQKNITLTNIMAGEGMKTCSKCKDEKSFDMFYCVHKGTAKERYHPDCKPCYLKRRADYVDRNRAEVNAKVKDYRVRNRDMVNAKARAYTARNPETIRACKLKQTYGLTIVEWGKLFSAQGGRCAICLSTTTTGRNWHTDHDHSTGKVRGILCHRCNTALGGYEHLRLIRDRVEAYLSVPDCGTKHTPADL